MRGTRPLTFITVAPRHCNRRQTEVRRAIEIMHAVAHHQRVGRGGVRKDVLNHLDLRGAAHLMISGAEEIHVLHQSGILQRKAGKALALARRRTDVQPQRLPPLEQLAHARKDRELTPANRRHVVRICLHGTLNLCRAQTRGRKGITHRRTRNLAQEILTRHLQPEGLHAPDKSRADAGVGVDEGAVYVYKNAHHTKPPCRICRLGAMTVTVADCVRALETAYPPQLAESWDKVGLICGDPEAPVTKVAFALDCTLEVAQRAVEKQVQLLVVHHPLLLRGVHSVAANTPKGKVIHTLLQGGVALFAAHTNADSARPGVSDKLAELVGIEPGRPIRPVLLDGIDHWGIHIPPADVDAVMGPLFDAGAGEIGNYRKCAFSFEGQGQFLPIDAASPTTGTPGELHRSTETRVEFVAPTRLRRTLIDTLREVHPYEEPAFDVVQMADTTDLSQATGLGRIGELPKAMTLREFTQQVADALPTTVWGVRAAGDPDQMVKRVAVSSGSGDSFLDDVTRLGVDVYVTSDLRHHPVDEHLRAGGPAVIDTAHWASEFPWTEQAAGIVAELDVETVILPVRTDPWTVSAHPADNPNVED